MHASRICIALACSLVVWTGAAARSQVAYAGAAHVYNLDAVTVVYPAAEGVAIAANRRAAQRIAGFLARTHEIAASVAADNAVTKEQRDGNLLLLGWDNRLLGEELASRPFTRSAAGFRFLEIEGKPGEQLLFAWRSPYNEEKLLVFWSRIDPELDRFQPFPAVGSDWAIYRHHQVLHQGNFLQTGTWPPVRNLEAERDRRDEMREDPVQRRSAHFVLHHAPGALSAEQSAQILAAREKALARAIALLGDPGQDFEIALHYFKDAEELEKRTGVPGSIHALAHERALYAAGRVALAPSPHEELHLVARALHGPSELNLFYEGVVIALENDLEDLGLDVHAAGLLEHEQLPALADLLDEAAFRKLPRPVALASAGLLVRWIRFVAGEPAVWRAYSWPEASGEALARLVGRATLAEAETAFRGWVETRAQGAVTDLAFQKAVGEASRLHAEGDWGGVAEALSRALALRPTDAQTLLNLGSARLRRGDYAAAIEPLQVLVGLDTPAADVHLIAFGYLQLGRAHDLLGRRDEARANYERVLSLPDRFGSHEQARTGLARPARVEDLVPKPPSAAAPSAAGAETAPPPSPPAPGPD